MSPEMNTDVNVQIVGPLIDVVEATKLTVNYVYKTAKLNIVLIFFFFLWRGQVYLADCLTVKGFL